MDSSDLGYLGMVFEIVLGCKGPFESKAQRDRTTANDVPHFRGAV